MKKLINILKIDNDYKEEIKKYNRTDMLFAFLLFLAYCLTMLLLGFLDKKDLLVGTAMTFSGIAVNLLFTFGTIGLLRLRKQGLETIGLKQGKVKLSLILGGILALLLFTCNCILNIIFEGAKFKSLSTIILLFFYYLSVGVVEEVMFRGYILTRLYALAHNNLVSVAVTGILFVLMHFPYRMMTGTSFFELISNYSYMLDLFVTHCVLSYIFMKTKSLYGSILPHWVSDLAYGILIH